MSSRSRRIVIILILLLLMAAVALLFGRCSRTQSPAPKSESPPAASAAAQTASPAPPAAQSAEVLTPATLKIPARVVAGASCRAEWTGPNNLGDYLTIVRPASAAATYQNYRETRDGAALELTAPIEAGEW